MKYGAIGKWDRRSANRLRISNERRGFLALFGPTLLLL